MIRLLYFILLHVFHIRFDYSFLILLHIFTYMIRLLLFYTMFYVKYTRTFIFSVPTWMINYFDIFDKINPAGMVLPTVKFLGVSRSS